MLGIRYGFGLFAERDYLRLSDDLNLTDSHLLDMVTGDRHRLHPLAIAALRPMKRGVVFHKWLLFMLGEELALAEVAEIVRFVNQIGGFRVERRWHKLFTPLISRRPASIRSLALAALAFMAPVILALTLLMGMLYASRMLILSDTVWLGVSLGLMLAISLFFHELAHITVAKRSNRPAVIVSGRLRIGVLHGKLTPKEEAVSAVSGALAGITVSVLSTASLWLISQKPVVILSGAGVVLFNLLSLLPLNSDGRSLKNLISGKIRFRHV